MREIYGHRPGRILIFILALSLIWYIFIVPFVVQHNNYLFLGWVPLVVVIWNIQTIVWLAAIYIYTTKYWPYR